MGIISDMWKKCYHFKVYNKVKDAEAGRPDG
jgi:hypothetical protein